MRKFRLLLVYVILSSLFLSHGSISIAQNNELEFNTEFSSETPLINLGIAKFKMIGEISLSPNFIIASDQNQKNIDSTDTITLSLDSNGFSGHLKITALGEKGKSIGSQTIPFNFEQSPLGDVVFRLPEVGIQFIIGLVTVSPRLIVSSKLSSEIKVEGPSTSSVNSVVWDADNQKSIHLNFHSNKEHVSVKLQNINYDLEIHLELGLKTLGYEVFDINTPSVSQKLISSISVISVGEYNAVPEPKFTYEPLNPTENEFVTFTDISTDNDGNIERCLWEFGDGSTDTSRNPSRKFPVGTFSIRLTVTDNEGAEGSLSETISILKSPQENAQNEGFLGLSFEQGGILSALILFGIYLVYKRMNRQ